MKKRILLIAITLMMFSIQGISQKKPLDFSVYDDWKTITSKDISNDGNWIYAEIEPYDGNSSLLLVNPEINYSIKFERATDAEFSPESDYIVFKIVPDKDTVRNLKLKETKKDDMPKDTLAIFLLEQKKIIKVPNLRNFKMAEDASSWIAYTIEKEKEETEDPEEDKGKEEKENEKENKKEKKFDKKAPEGYELINYNPVDNIKHAYKDVIEYTISENGKSIAFIQLQNDSLLKSTISHFDTRKRTSNTIFALEGLSDKLTLDKEGNQVAFIHSEDTTETKVYSLYYRNISDDKTRKVIDTLSTSVPEKWTVSKNGNVYFSDNCDRIYFGIAQKPEPEPEDTLLEEEKVKLDLWSWTDPLLQPQQLENASREKKRTYLTVYHINENKVIQLENKTMNDVRIIQDGDADVAIAYDDLPYQKLTSWEMPPYHDIYLVNVKTGSSELIKKRIQSPLFLSDFGNYLFWYCYKDSNWYAQDTRSKLINCLTKDINVPFYDVEHDYPNDPDPYRFAGWTEDDEYVLIYDQYDIWKVDPSGKEEAVNLTNGYGRKNSITFRYQRTNYEIDHIDSKDPILLRAYNNETKESGFFTAKIKKSADPKQLIMKDYSYSGLEKARDAGKYIFQKSSYKEFYDVWFVGESFENPVRITKANPQQDNYLWGEVELVKWITTEGTVEEGLLYKPENFDPDKKYPMIVYFYRLSSDRYHSHYIPRPSRSVINPTFYVSNGYFVFIPNIRYKIGYPGESAYNYVVSGTLALLNSRSYLDKDRIGLQGQSWGGYQVAHIITKTDMFAAASAGAPVSNMTSAYGGIRWGSGMSRMFQYEETQSRIGGTLWEKPLHYIENSPVFYAPKVNTPLLMRHNDGDGAVPWYQGIEYFVALRRLNKPVWMLNYNDAPHNESFRSPNCKDLSIRMKQFFDHYLKGEKAPEWMVRGIPAVDKGIDYGLELVD